MGFYHYEQRAIPYGSLKITVCAAKNEYMPTNEEVFELTREIFGLPTRDIYEKLNVRLYWYQNVRIFECLLTDFIDKGFFRTKINFDVYNIMTDAGEAGYANNWIVTTGSSLINEVYGITLVKVV